MAEHVFVFDLTQRPKVTGELKMGVLKSGRRNKTAGNGRKLAFFIFVI